MKCLFMNKINKNLPYIKNKLPACLRLSKKLMNKYVLFHLFGFDLSQVIGLFEALKNNEE